MESKRTCLLLASDFHTFSRCSGNRSAAFSFMFIEKPPSRVFNWEGIYPLPAGFLASRGDLYQTACPCTLQSPKIKRLHGNGLQGQKISFLERPENFSERGMKKGAALQESMGKNQYSKAP
ncbi:MAG: hypothetical protein L0Z48_08170, partial [candidate division Zixibacteria bacterium]|nr:hypothetical protein [candidate division Zixibacteria bacterium]